MFSKRFERFQFLFSKFQYKNLCFLEDLKGFSCFFQRFQLFFQSFKTYVNNLGRWICQGLRECYRFGNEECLQVLRDSFRQFQEAKGLHGTSSAQSWKEWKIIASEAADSEVERFKKQLEEIMEPLKVMNSEMELKVTKFQKRIKFLAEVKEFIETEFKVFPREEVAVVSAAA